MATAVATASKSDVEDFESNFKQSLDFLHELAQKNQQSLASNPVSHTMTPIPAHPFHNQTLKQYTSPTSSSIKYAPPPNIVSTISAPPQINSTSMRITPSFTPQYGCMKNGTLPTYRMWKQQTQKNYPVGAFGAPQPQIQTQVQTQQPPIAPPNSMSSSLSPVNTEANIPLEWQEQREKWNKLMKKFQSPDWLKQKKEIREYQKIKEKEKESKSKPKFVRRKMRKTARRTFRLGRSKYYPRVSVLVSNRTIRKQISDQCQKLKQVPIEEVRKVLIKKGLIKVGSIAPNDVLRKMYESVSTVCGDVRNHNADNLVYNYFHDKL